MAPASSHQHCAEDLIALFNDCFSESHRTVLVRGDHEPIYHTWQGQSAAQIVFAHGYFSSALHEIAHWCIAGPERLKQDDYGYWYLPDGRNHQQQQAFEKVEVKPQALEWLFSLAAGYPFVFSADNLDGDVGDMATFKAAVVAQAGRYLKAGPKRRARKWLRALSAHYGTVEKLDRLRQQWPACPEAVL